MGTRVSLRSPQDDGTGDSRGAGKYSRFRDALALIR